MTVTQENTQQPSQEQVKENSKEYNFRQLEAKLQQERVARLEAERLAQEAMQRIQQQQIREEPEEDDSDPYVDNKKLNKKFSSFEKKMEEKIEKKAEEKARQMIYSQRKDDWIRQNPDFYEVMQHAEKFAQRDPELAETILEMPDTFERQKLVYRNIKSMGIHKPEEKKSTIQDKVNANQRSPYYQPSGMGAAPYSMAGDFSPVGQKQAYQKLQELKNKLRI